MFTQPHFAAVAVALFQSVWVLLKVNVCFCDEVQQTLLPNSGVESLWISGSVTVDVSFFNTQIQVCASH